MKKHYLTALCILSVSALYAQGPLFNTSQDIDINNIKAAHLVHGDMWWNPTTSGAACEFPKGSGKHLAHATSLWIGGFSTGGTFSMAAQAYRQSGTDYWPGPIDPTSNISTRYANQTKWAKIWKVNKSTIDSFRNTTTHTQGNTPTDILSWPAMGNPYTAGNNGAALTITTPMAPFVDVDANGSYNPLLGDYPLIKGDQMLWWVINDAGGPHTVTQTSPLSLEIQHSVYAYKRGGMIDNMVFYEYIVINKGQTQIDSLRFGIASDIELGNGTDDYIGFDSVRRMGVGYNSNSVDGTGQAGAYGSNIPMVGLAFVELPGDVGNNYVPAGSFMNFDNSWGANGNPVSGIEFYNLLNSRNKSGMPLRNGKIYSSTLTSDCDSMVHIIDQRLVLASNTLSMGPGASKKIAMALVVAPDAGGCPTMNFSGILATSDSAWIVYHNPPNALGLHTVVARQPLHIYPNPANNVLYIEPSKGQTTGTVQLYDAVGRSVNVPVKQVSGKLEVSTVTLTPGIYMVVYKSAQGTQVAKFTKQQ